MSESTKKERSPNYPRLTLEDSITKVTQLRQNAGKAKINPEAAVQALGYAGLNGASLGTLGALTAYGLLDKDKAGSVFVSDLAIKILFPTNGTERRAALREAAMLPPIFAAIRDNGHTACSESVLASQLIRQKFTDDGARRAAIIFRSNATFAGFDEDATTTGVNANQTITTAISQNNLLPQGQSAAIGSAPMPEPVSQVALSNQGSELPIPLIDGGRVARIPYPMSEAAFETFKKSLDLFKPLIVIQEVPPHDPS